MQVNPNIVPRALTEEEKTLRRQDVYDSFANYLCFCPKCGHVDKTNMYLMRAESRVRKLNEEGQACPVCGAKEWELGYPQNSKTGFVRRFDI